MQTVTVPLQSATDVLRYAQLLPPTRRAVLRELAGKIVQYTVVLDDGMMPVAKEIVVPLPDREWSIGDGKMTVLGGYIKYPGGVSSVMKEFGMNLELHLPVICALKPGEKHSFETAPGSRFPNVLVEAFEKRDSSGYSKDLAVNFTVEDDRRRLVEKLDEPFVTAGYTVFDL